LPGGRKQHLLVSAHEKLGFQLLFKLLNARGDIGLRATKLFRRLSDALGFGHQFKDQ